MKTYIVYFDHGFEGYSFTDPTVIIRARDSAAARKKLDKWANKRGEWTYFRSAELVAVDEELS